jgi:glycosyltransferase involved in cell wall biosynthesis
MFDSVIAQKWDNIELIIVNDGSSDGTREIIAEYEGKFHGRGFGMIIIDQENKGVAHAVREGLKRVTGDYVCQVDADDEMDTAYVSTMAGWLESHSEYEWAACDAVVSRKDGSQIIKALNVDVDLDSNLKKFVFWKTSTVLIYMIRTDYLRSISVLKYFNDKRVCTQEPQLFLPLLVGGGKMKYFEADLYKVNYLCTDGHLSYSNSHNKMLAHYTSWYDAVKDTINILPIDNHKKKKLLVIAEIARVGKILEFLELSYNDGERSDIDRDEIFQTMSQEYLDLIDTRFAVGYKALGPKLGAISLLVHTVENNLLGIPPLDINTPSGSIIAWGALGNCGKIFLPYLGGTMFEPDELWDMAGDGNKVKKPAPDMLSPNDFVIICPQSGGAAAAIRAMAEAAGCPCAALLDVLTSEILKGA